MKALALDIESVGTDIIDGIVWSITTFDGKKIKCQSDCNGITYIDEATANDLENPDILKVIHNAAFDGSYLFHNCRRRNGKLIIIVNIWDTDITEQVIQGIVPEKKLKDNDPFRIKHGTKLKHVLPRYGLGKGMNKDIVKNFIDRPRGMPFVKPELVYMVGDVKDLLHLQKAQEFILKRDGLFELALVENKFVELVINMKKYGIGFDAKFWIELAKKNAAEFERRTQKLPKEVTNWNSEKQVKAYFRKRGILIESYDQLDEVLLQTQNNVLRDFINQRELHKAVSAYGMNWFQDGYIDPDGRIRFDMRQIVNTGRNSISKPPLHNMPKKGDFRGAFVPRPGHMFVLGDFGGQEIGIMAAMANEKVWIDALLRGDDVHSLTASMLYQGEWKSGGKKNCSFPGKCECPNHEALREHAKTLNFMLAYGGGPKKFAASTGLSFLDARIVVSRYKSIIPQLTKTLERNAKVALNTGETYSADPYKRRRLLLGDEAWHIENQGKNSPIQMAGANMMKLAAISVPSKYYIPMIWHDEIILEVKKVEAETAAKVLKKIMEQSADYITGIKGLIKVKPRIANNLLKPKKK